MSIPSLRQKQINEVLDYHRLINRTVFDRNVKSVHLSNQAKAEPHRTDIETEANLRERVDKMKTTLQQLIQSSSYDDTDIDLETGGESKEGTMEGRTIDISASFMKNKVDSILASLLGDYNGICTLYDAKNRAKVFSQSEGIALVGIVKELHDPIIEAIGKLMQYKDATKKYFQTYRVLKTLMDNIDSAPPLQKIPISLLTEPYFIPNPTKIKPIDTPLWKHMLESRNAVASKLQEYSKIVASSAAEKAAKNSTMQNLERVLVRIDKLLETNAKAIQKDDSSYAIAFKNYESLADLDNPSTPASIRAEYNKLKGLIAKARDPYDLNEMLGLFDEPIDLKPVGPTSDLSDKFAELSMSQGMPSWTPDALQSLDQDKLEKLKYQLTQNIRIVYDRMRQDERRGMSDEEQKSNYIVIEELSTSLDNVIDELESRMPAPAPRSVSGPVKPTKAKKLSYTSKIILIQKRIDEIKREMLTASGSDLRSLKAELFKLKKERDAPVPHRRVIAEESEESEEESSDSDDSDAADRARDRLAARRARLADLKRYTEKEEKSYRKKQLNEGKKSKKERPVAQRRARSEESDEESSEESDPARRAISEHIKRYTKGKGKKGSGEFGDDSVLAPYLSKHLKPSKFHKPIKPADSSEAESESDMDPDHVTSSDESEVGGRRRKKKAVNPNAFIKQGKEGVALLEKIMAKPRGGRKKAVKPILDNKRDADMWFV